MAEYADSIHTNIRPSLAETVKIKEFLTKVIFQSCRVRRRDRKMYTRFKYLISMYNHSIYTGLETSILHAMVWIIPNTTPTFPMLW